VRGRTTWWFTGGALMVGLDSNDVLVLLVVADRMGAFVHPLARPVLGSISA
jgi:hypothetical protein